MELLFPLCLAYSWCWMPLAIHKVPSTLLFPESCLIAGPKTPAARVFCLLQHALQSKQPLAVA